MTGWEGRFVLLLFLVALLSSFASAQDTGSINGGVADSSGARIPGVTATLRSPAIQGDRTVITDERGGYRFILLPTGTYSVTYELPGFKTIIREGVIVEAGRAVTLNIELEVATVAETVTVTGESPIVDVQNAAVGVNFSATLLRDIPTSRDFWAILRASPGTTTTAYDVGGSNMGSQAGYRSFGMSVGQNFNLLDGVMVASGMGGYWDYAVLAEMRISGAANSAEIPVPGTALNAVFKTGGNALHGEAYFDWEGDALQNTNMTEALRNQGIFEGDKFVRWRSYNFQAGGPIKKDKFWYFLSFSQQYSALKTELRHRDGTPGAMFTTDLKNPTIKLNYQINANNAFIFSGQANRKHQPFRLGQGPSATFYTEDSTYNQMSWEWVGKVQWTSVLSNKSTLDTMVGYFGDFFPSKARVQETPSFDQTTQARRGGTDGTFRYLFRRWRGESKYGHFESNFLGGSHDLKVGYSMNWNAPRQWLTSSPGTPGVTLGDTTLIFNNGAPAQFTTKNTPFRTGNFDMNHGAFFQDKIQIGRRLTLNIGMRWDRYHEYTPPQGNVKSGLAITPGPFAPEVFYPKRDIATLNNVVPRLGLVYDVFGNAKTAVKLNYGRYSEYLGGEMATLANPNTVITRTYAWNGTLPITPALVATSQLLSVSGQAANIAVDPNLSNSYLDEYVAGIQREVAANLDLNVNFVRKIRHNLWGTVNRAQPASGFAPVAALDPGRDGVLGNSDDRPFTVFERRVPAASDLYLTNMDQGDNFSTIGVEMTKRFSNRWQMVTGWDWTKRNLSSNISLDPNVFLYGPNGAHTSGWTYKLVGSYRLPKGIGFSGTYNAQNGEAYGRRANFNATNLVGRTTNLAQGTTTVLVEPVGSYYYPTTNLINLRLDKVFSIGENGKLAGMVDVFNILNHNTVVGVNDLTGTVVDRKGARVPTFGRATQILNPRIARLGVRYTF